MSQRLAEAGARILESKISRRGFFRRAALTGAALASVPLTYVLEPGTAYSAVVRSPSSCGSGARCRASGWTEFCCTMSGVNTCPPGTLVAGWWRAEYPGSGVNHCGGSSRYYMDCNSADCGGCACGGSGTCTSSCAGCSCTCANGNCNHWRTCCTRFRYGQCNQHVACVGPIVCRVVTCVPPWEWDSTCTRSDAVSQSTWYHDAACLHPSRVLPALPAVMRGDTWLIRTRLSGGAHMSSYAYGLPGDVPLVADWSGSGIRTSAVVRGARRGPSGDTGLRWMIRQVPGGGQPDVSFVFGRAGDIPVAGDWNGDGTATPGVVRGNRWMLRDANSAGSADREFTFGEPGDVPVVGRWTDDGITRPGVVRGTRWILQTTNSGSTVSFDFGPGGTPVVGDWTGNGVDRPGWYRDGTWHLRNQLSSGQTETTFNFGEPGDRPLVWGQVQ